MRTLAIAAATALAGIAVMTPVVHADEIDKKTTIRVNETILIPGRTLTPGTYVIKLARSFTNRNIVQIYNEDQTKLQATILAINNYRLVTKDKTVLQYWETPNGSPPALRAWFSPGDNYGQEFAYPKKMAEELARTNNNAAVPFVADTAPVGSPQLDNVDIGTTSPASATPAREPARGETPAFPPPPKSKAPPSVFDAQAQPAPAAETLLAQNQPPPPNPVTNQPTRTPPASTTSLPQTATSLGWVLAIGLLALLSATIFRFMRRA